MADTREPFNGLLHGVYQIALLVSFIPGLPKYMQYSTFFVLVWIAHYMITKMTTGNPAVDLALGSAILTQLMNPVDNFFFTDPDSLNDVYHHQNQKGKITTAPLKERIKWAFHLFINARGIGWAHESRCTPPRVLPATTHSAFVLRQLKRAVFCMALECAAYTTNASNPYMTYTVGRLTTAPFIWRALGVAAFASAGYARINWMHCLLSAAVVGVGLSLPERWPNLFGSPLQAWSVARFWRFTWHHLLRKPLRAFATVFTSVLFKHPRQPFNPKQKIPAASHSFSETARNLIWACTAFLMSGLIHIGGEVMLTGHISYGAFTFFALQPIAIIIETLVAFLWHSITRQPQPKASYKSPASDNGNADSGTEGASVSCFVGSEVEQAGAGQLWMRYAGYVWVALWFVWSLAFMIDPMIPTSMFVDARVDLRTKEWYL
ncbi:hypothetical protein BDN70DRAFT_874080 [Pholiota conissans]|uniref:Wax synthase domain-containing protein n=1 Tax=Pholiota conissans TaxID=109636 RepID=A0A9P6D476_9AGAR|nr:hypothetical protein BDN70DRAFT_874080 [Pholiota conissans]